MNLSLKELYQSYIPQFKRIVNLFPNDDVAGPLMMSPNAKYKNARTRLLVVGHETNGWGYHSEEVENGMIHYDKFNLGTTRNSDPFWNVVRKIECLLGNEPYSCVWTNISKYDVNQKTPVGRYLEEIQTLDKLLVEEIKIVKPDLIIFFTGPNLDFRIKSVFKSINYSAIDGFSERQLAILKHPLLSSKVIRTYHPRYLRQGKLEDCFLKYLKLSI